jgi:hypothetical protein
MTFRTGGIELNFEERNFLKNPEVRRKAKRVLNCSNLAGNLKFDCRHFCFQNFFFKMFHLITEFIEFSPRYIIKPPAQ